MFGLRLPRAAALVIAGAFLMIALLLLALYFWSPRATLRITTGPAGGIAQRFISAFVSVTMALHPRIRFETVPVANLEESSKAMEDDRVDIALVRSDVKPPVNGQTLVILRRRYCDCSPCEVANQEYDRSLWQNNRRSQWASSRL